MATDKATQEAIDDIRGFVRDLLEERFKDEFEFGPIVLIPRYDDPDGYEFLHSYIVFHGDQKKLDSRWTLRMSRRISERCEEINYPGIPIPMFVERSEWPYLERSLKMNEDYYDGD